MKLAVLISCLLSQLLSSYIFVTYAINSQSDLWQYCAIVVIAATVVEAMVVTEKKL